MSREPSAKDFGRQALNDPSAAGATKEGITMGNIDDPPESIIGEKPTKGEYVEPPSGEKKAALQKLLTEYDAQEEACEQLRTALEAAMKSRSDIVKQVAKIVEPAKSFVRAGRGEVSIVNRDGNFFFRGAKVRKNLIEV